MTKAFGLYFHDIIKQIGTPALKTEQISYKDEKSQERYKKFTSVSFSKPLPITNTFSPDHPNISQSKSQDLGR